MPSNTHKIKNLLTNDVEFYIGLREILEDI
jgi:hypothetical protein